MFHKFRYFLSFLLAVVFVFISRVGYFHVISQVHAVEMKSPQTELGKKQSKGYISYKSEIARIPILMYHYVEHVRDKRDTIRQKLNIYPETLSSQIKTLQDDGYTFLRMSEIGEIIDGKKQIPTKPIVLTFDDGYKDFYTDVLPVLQKHNVPATAYIITNFIGRPNYMTRKQLDTVQASGLVELGAHTIHHVDLPHVTEVFARKEIVKSKEALELWYGSPVVSFAYPNGRFSDNLEKLVKEAGFTNAVSTLPGSSIANENRFRLYRLRPSARRGQALLQFLKTEVSM